MKLGLAGHVVYSLSCFGKQASDTGKGDNVEITDEQKIILDLVHLRKIQESDSIVVVNPDGYVGESTSREIRWAIMLQKYIYVIHDYEGFQNKFPDAIYWAAEAKDLL